MAKLDPNSYIHSRVTSEVVDNSIVPEQRNVTIKFVYFQPYFSDKGEDGTLETHVYETDFISNKGTPNVKKHGQAIYNIINWLRGGGEVLGMRLAADNATSSYGVLNIRTRVKADHTVEIDKDGTPTEFTFDALEVSPTMSPVPATVLNNIPNSLPERQKLQLIAKMLQQSANVNGANGWKNNYLTVFKCKGKGKYGNELGIKMVLNSTVDEDFKDARRYYFEFIEKSPVGNPKSVSELTTIAFNPISQDITKTISHYLDSVVATDTFKGKFDSIALFTSQDCWERLISTVTPFCSKVDIDDADEYVEDPKNVDYFSLVDKRGDKYLKFIEPEDISTLPTNGDDTDFGYTGGYFMGGSDGSLDPAFYPQDGSVDVYEEIEKVRNALLVKAYKGEINSSILSPYKYQINVIIDGNFGEFVKKEMVYLSRKRLDIVPYIDFGFVASAEAAINLRNQVYNDILDWQVGIFPQSAQGYDSYNKQWIDVTYTYDLAYKLPYNRRFVGPNKFVAGNRKGAIATVKNFSWLPEDEDMKTYLAKAQLNYVEEIREGEFAIMSSRTAYPIRLSYLAVLRNVHAICEAMWIGRQILVDLRFEEEAVVAMVEAKEAVLRNCQYLVTNGPVAKINCKVWQTQQDVYESAARVALELKFRDFIHTWRFQIVAVR